MRLLHFEQLKRKVLAQGERDVEFQKRVRAIVPENLLKIATLGKARIMLSATNKTAAQELFLQRDRISEEIKKFKEYTYHQLIIS